MNYNCTTCGVLLTIDNWSPSRMQKNAHICRHCANKYANDRYYSTPPNRKSKTLFSIVVDRTNILQYAQCTNLTDHVGIMNTIRYTEFKPIIPTNNKLSSTYFGVVITEQVLSMVFNDVERMPYGNHGYDFICSGGKKIDSKSAVIGKCKRGYTRWRFNIKKNTIADYFAILAFDNREDLNPLYMWVIPGEKLNDKNSASISIGTIDKWDEYKWPIGKVITCCNAIRTQ